MKRTVWVPVHRAEHDGDHGPAGEDVDGGELVHLAHALQLADVEAVQADELARTAGGQAEPEGLVLPRRLGQKPGGGRRDGGRPGQPLGPPPQTVGDQDLLHGRLGDREAPVRRDGRRTGDSRWWARGRPG